MGLESASFINDLVSTNPISSDQAGQGDDHIRLLKAVIKATLPNATKAFYFPEGLAKTANYTILASDQNCFITADATSAAFALTLPTLAAGDDGWMCFIKKIDATANAVTVTATINGASNYVLGTQYGGAFFVWSGTAWYTFSEDDIASFTALTDPAIGDLLPILDISANTKKKITLANILKVINALTADASPDASADYVVTYDASATAAKKVLLQNLPGQLPRGWISGLVCSNGTDATNDINISAGKCRDSTDAFDIVISTALGKQLDANWVAGGTPGSPAGMRNSAAGTDNKTYHLYAVRTAASSAGDVYAVEGVAGTDPDSSAAIAAVITAIQLESGGANYVYARRIWSITRVSAANRLFTQDGDYCRFKTPTMDFNNTLGTTSSTFALASIPLGLTVFIDANVVSEGGAYLYLRHPDDTDTAPSHNAAPLSGFGTNDAITNTDTQRIWCNRSAQIAGRSTNAGIPVRIAPMGYLDIRGKG